MNIILKEQRARIQELYSILEGIRQDELLFTELDPKYLAEKKAAEIEKYASRLTDLFEITFKKSAKKLNNLYA